MKIHFGLHLDGERVFAPANHLGEVRAGPLGLLGILETQLGLLRDGASQPERIVHYRDCLKQCDHPERFYHASYNADELGTAARLLSWRDTWLLHGWDGEFRTASSSRLKDLGEVEQLARGTVSPSLGERLAFVSTAIQRRRPPIAEIELHDPIEVFPKRWRDVLSQLPVKVAGDGVATSRGKGFLGELQRALLNALGGEKPRKMDWSPDGTVRVVRSETQHLAARWLKSHLALEAAGSLLVAHQDGQRLDDILGANHLPRAGLRDTSAFRPSLQALPLALDILWDPINFYGLLQFLTHPICPIPGFARHKLAGKLADKPGIGGKAWVDILDKIKAHHGGADTEDARAVLEKIRFWIEHERYPKDAGAPLATVIERVEHLTRYFRGRLADEDRTSRIAFSSSFGQCRVVGNALKALQQQGNTHIRPRQLQQLLAQATASGSENQLLVAEVGASLVATHPGAAVAPCKHVFWWQLGMPRLPEAYPWSEREIGELAAAGVQLPTPTTLLEQASAEWVRPILAAENSLTLILPAADAETHPVWQMIEALVTEVPVIRLESLLEMPASGMKPVEHLPLPQRQRCWHLPKGIEIRNPPRVSFSSLEKYLFNPYHWLLEYPVRLKASRILSVSNDFRLFGNIAHDLVERYYLRPVSLTETDADFEQWFSANFDRIIEEEGAILLMPGRRSDLENYRLRLKRAILELRQQIRQAGAVSITPEMQLDGSFAGGGLIGYADLVLEKAFGEQAILDMKWSGSKKYPAKLKQGRHLQLVLYAELLRQKTGSWPRLGYYILDRARLFAEDNAYFTAAEAVDSSAGENTAELWQRFIQTWKWRQEQVKCGAFEVALEGIPETEESMPPGDAFSMEYLPPEYNEYIALAGWEQEP